MSSYSSSNSSGECPNRFAGNTQFRQHGCYVDLDGALLEVPLLDCEQKLREYGCYLDLSGAYYEVPRLGCEQNLR